MRTTNPTTSRSRRLEAAHGSIWPAPGYSCVTPLATHMPPSKVRDQALLRRTNGFSTTVEITSFSVFCLPSPLVLCPFSYISIFPLLHIPCDNWLGVFSLAFQHKKHFLVVWLLKISEDLFQVASHEEPLAILKFQCYRLSEPTSLLLIPMCYLYIRLQIMYYMLNTKLR